MDVEELFPELAPFRRETVRLHPRSGRPTCRDSSVGGPLLWPAREPWPQCPEHPGSPMVAVVQIHHADVPDTVGFPAGRDLLQVLWCPRRHARQWVVPLVRWRSAEEVGEVREAPPAPADVPYGRVPRPCVVHPETVTEYPSWDLPDELWDALDARFDQVAEETGWDYQYHLSTAPGTKLGGYPGWSQEPRWPVCPRCSTPMDHLLTVDSTEEHDDRQAWTPVEDRDVTGEGAGLSLGDLDGIRLFECRSCPGRPFAHRYGV
ncbi:DUF1963 domain-containing protein [Streptomyces sp. SP17BM10]|uniref:DUF1963 domain-containing protein n=1 Tax=Streptomyces sp. SP17BM10 TaxID=3002530 RepID=UPI002E7A596D|nr:DUF1963 domain-containing protein [Streptomyces sp. SP17BM10]MEE1782085.1 DUF1963 domain-containing protein [Streptomyces sp. SP17BM10]